jgi:hypothetical protein
VTDFKEYELRPLRMGQVCVTRDAGEGFCAFRAVPEGHNGLRWEPLDPLSIGTQAAINGYCAWLTHSAEAAWHPECAVTQRQIAQLVAHRSTMLALAPNAPLIKIAFLSVTTVLRAVMGDNVAVAMSTLPRLGLDIGTSRNRMALQTVINLAEKTGCEHLLDAMNIQPLALEGFFNATRWIDERATPLFLMELARLAHTNELARDLANQTKATVPTLAPTSMTPSMALEA